jgi:hypothetical protein
VGPLITRGVTPGVGTWLREIRVQYVGCVQEEFSSARPDRACWLFTDGLPMRQPEQSRSRA